MARKIDKQDPAAEPPSAAEQLAVLDPARVLTIAGRTVTIREYGFFEGLRVLARSADFIADLHALMAKADFRFYRIRPLFGVYEETVVAIAAQAADVEPEWV